MVGMDLAVVWPWSTGESRAGISVEGGMSSIAYNTLRLFAVALGEVHRRTVPRRRRGAGCQGRGRARGDSLTP